MLMAGGVSAAKPFPAPSNLSATAVSTSQINLSWTDNSSDETGFSVERSTDGVNFSEIIKVGAGVSSHSDTSLNSSTTYYYKVRAYILKNGVYTYSSYSNIDSDQTFATIPDAPSNLFTYASSTDSIYIGWTDNSFNEDGFKIERSSDGQNYSQIDSVGAGVNTYLDTNVSQNSYYYYRVRSYNSAGNSSYSNIGTMATGGYIAAPTNLTASTTGTSTLIFVNFSDNSNNEDGFVVERSTDGVNFSYLDMIYDTWQYSPSYAEGYYDTNVSSGNTYYYRVRAVNFWTISDYSNVDSVTLY